MCRVWWFHTLSMANIFSLRIKWNTKCVLIHNIQMPHGENVIIIEYYIVCVICISFRFWQCLVVAKLCEDSTKKKTDYPKPKALLNKPFLCFLCAACTVNVYQSINSLINNSFDRRMEIDANPSAIWQFSCLYYLHQLCAVVEERIENNNLRWFRECNMISKR